MAVQASKGRFTLIRDNGVVCEALAPVIVSASRATDIPAFYPEWLVRRLSRGYVKWTNPFNGVPRYVSFADTRVIVFWSKNPQPLMSHLLRIDERGINQGGVCGFHARYRGA